MSAVSPAVLPPALVTWRWRIFASTWLCYAGYYFCRKPFYIAKSAIGHELSFDATALGVVGSVYLVAYTFGQFASGALGNRLGPRFLLLLGMTVSIAANIGFGLSNSFESFVVLMALNGLVQATGWSGGVGTMANWFRRSERGTVMGFWATNFQAGGVLANTLAAWVLGKWGFRYSFFTGALVLLCVQVFFVFNQRNRPEDLGLPAVDDPDEPKEGEDQVVAWTVERANGGRGFGTTGGHFYAQWWNPEWRRLMLNAIAWTARIEVPPAGVDSEEFGRFISSELVKWRGKADYDSVCEPISMAPGGEGFEDADLVNIDLP